MQIIPVVLSGGSGTRLWPLSRKDYPKQYLTLASENSLLQETILRLTGIDNLLDPIIVCNSDHRFIVVEQCNQINIKNPIILLEPVGRNTAPAVAAAALYSLRLFDDALLLVLSADHVIQDVEAFHQAINIAIRHVEKGKLATFGIVPTYANTGYGYLKSSRSIIDGAHQVIEFIEKPDLKAAQNYLENGNYLWNSGMFMFKADTFINELSAYSPDIVESVSDAVKNFEIDLNFIRLDREAFESSPSDSIDYALMEKSDSVIVVPLDAGWNDVGSWSAMKDIGSKDRSGNIIKGDVVLKDTKNSFIYASHHMVVTNDVDNLIIVDTPDATYISSQDKANEVKSIVKSLETKGRDEAYSNRKVYRPWGWFDCIEVGKHFQVKKLYVNPGAKLSLQMHKNRAEHWVVVSGTATVINGEDVITLKEGDSTFIPKFTTHGLENKTSMPLEIIEVQSGAYLGEDDIVRFEDIYGRVIE